MGLKSLLLNRGSDREGHLLWSPSVLDCTLPEGRLEPRSSVHRPQHLHVAWGSQDMHVGWMDWNGGPVEMR